MNNVNKTAGRGMLCAWCCAATLLMAGCTSAPPPALEKIGVLAVPYGIQSMAWHPDGKRLAIGYFWKTEVEVWDVEQKKPLFKVPSARRGMNHSGQEVLFSPDGKYMVVQDFEDRRKDGPRFPKTEQDPNELPARADKTKYLLGRVWDIAQQKEITQLLGPGSVAYGQGLRGMCWAAGKQEYLVVHRLSLISI